MFYSKIVFGMPVLLEHIPETERMIDANGQIF